MNRYVHVIDKNGKHLDCDVRKIVYRFKKTIPIVEHGYGFRRVEPVKSRWGKCVNFNLFLGKDYGDDNGNSYRARSYRSGRSKASGR